MFVMSTIACYRGLSIGKVGDEEDQNVKTVCTDGTACNVGE